MPWWHSLGRRATVPREAERNFHCVVIFKKSKSKINLRQYQQSQSRRGGLE